MSVKRPLPLERLRHFTSVGSLDADLPWSAPGRGFAILLHRRRRVPRVRRTTTGVDNTMYALLGPFGRVVHAWSAPVAYKAQPDPLPTPA